MSISNHLTALAEDINAVLVRKAKNHEEWIEIELDTCRIFAEARAEFKDDIGFGHWMSDRYTYAGIQKPHPNESAAYVGMGKELEKARSVLEKTERSSIRYIYENEFKTSFTSASKRPYRKVQPSQSAPGPDVEAEIVTRMDGGASSNTVAEDLKVPPRDVRRVYEREAIRREAREEGALEEAPLSATAQKKIDAHKRRLEKDFEYRVLQEAIKRSDKAEARIRARWNENAGKLESAWQRRGKVFSKAEFNLIMRCLHPDTGASVGDEARAEAFRLFNDRKIKLLDDEAFPVAHKARMPSSQTAGEREARRAAYEAEKAAKRAAAKAAKASNKEAHP